MKNARGEARAALDARSEVEVELGTLKENHAKMAKQLKESVRARDSAEAGLRTTEKQFGDMRKQLHYTEINMATEKQLVTELREELRKAREAANYLKRRPRLRSKLCTPLGYRRLKANSQRSSPP